MTPNLDKPSDRPTVPDEGTYPILFSDEDLERYHEAEMRKEVDMMAGVAHQVLLYMFTIIYAILVLATLTALFLDDEGLLPNLVGGFIIIGAALLGYLVAVRITEVR